MIVFQIKEVKKKNRKRVGGKRNTTGSFLLNENHTAFTCTCRRFTTHTISKTQYPWQNCRKMATIVFHIKKEKKQEKSREKMQYHGSIVSERKPSCIYIQTGHSTQKQQNTAPMRPPPTEQRQQTSTNQK